MIGKILIIGIVIIGLIAGGVWVFTGMSSLIKRYILMLIIIGGFIYSLIVMKHKLGG